MSANMQRKRRGNKNTTTPISPVNERLLALNVLTEWYDAKTLLSSFLDKHHDVSSLTKELCFGVCRHLLRLELLADKLATKRPKDTQVWLCLLLGLYQLHYLRMPDYAVVKETVGLLDLIKKSWAKSFVNALLRRFCRESASLIESLTTDPLFMYGHPLWLVKRLQHAWPNDWPKILNANDAHPPMHLRANRQQTTRDDYLEALHQAGLSATPHPWANECITLDKACSVHHLPHFSEGAVSVQDAAAQLAASLLALSPGLRVLDACCAPGGKTCHGLEIEPNIQCTALDLDAHRLVRVEDNLRRLKLTATVIQGDTLHPSLWWDGIPFDRILLDAPCSATGVIRRHPDIKWVRTAKDIEHIVDVQRAMLRELWPLLAPQGRLVYATCSIMPEENEHQIMAFAKGTPDCHVLPIETPWGQATAHGRQILPGEAGMDGFFYSVLVKY